MRWFWFWLIGFGGMFVVAEVLALTDDAPGDTLSESLRWLVNNSEAGTILFILFFVWFIPHILVKRFDKDDPKPNPDPAQVPNSDSEVHNTEEP
jgi:hypothetical protein